MKTPICLDESIHTVRIARDAIAAGACRIINIKPGRVGGHREAISLHDLCAEHGIPVWCGGMLETGIGRAHNIHLASLPNFSLPGDIAASKRYYAARSDRAADRGRVRWHHRRARTVRASASHIVPNASSTRRSATVTTRSPHADRRMTQRLSSSGSRRWRSRLRLLGACASAPPAGARAPRPQLHLRREDVVDPAARGGPRARAAGAAGAAPRRRRAAARGDALRSSSPPPPPQPDLIALLKDDEARIRRRAALAIGRTRLPEGSQPLVAAARRRHRSRSAADGRVCARPDRRRQRRRSH